MDCCCSHKVPGWVKRQRFQLVTAPVLVIVTASQNPLQLYFIIAHQDFALQSRPPEMRPQFETP